MTQPSFKLDPAHLAKVIDAQQTAYGKITAASNGVQADADIVRQGLQSTSGQNLQTGFLDWTSNFQNIIRSLEELKEKVTGVRTTGENTDADATGTARVPSSGYSI